MEEQLKNALFQILSQASQSGLSIGTIYYVFKDVYNDFSKAYFDYINQQLQQQQKEEEQKDDNESISNASDNI